MLVGYRYYDQHTEEILYPFGHGLSYTSFEYSNITVNRSNNTYEITFSLKNTGDIKGSEIVQLYVSNPDSVAPRPLKELKAFKKTELNAGEKKTVSLCVDINDLGYYNVLLNKWVTEEGKYIFYVAASSQDIRLKKEVYIKDKTEYTVKKVSDSMVG